MKDKIKARITELDGLIKELNKVIKSTMGLMEPNGILRNGIVITYQDEGFKISKYQAEVLALERIKIELERLLK